MTHFNGLTPAEAERLALLAEECAEVIQVVTKILRHGYESANPFDPAKVPNRALLASEYGHVHAAVQLLVDHADIDIKTAVRAAKLKLDGVGKWLHHATNGAHT